MTHPSGVGTWELALKRDPRVRVRSPGHTALDAWREARVLLGSDSFADIEEPTLLSDKPIPKPVVVPAEKVA
jgi:hypothetical protein